jgi:hypothetical protein
LGEGGYVQPLKRVLRDGLFRCRYSDYLLPKNWQKKEHFLF